MVVVGFLSRKKLEKELCGLIVLDLFFLKFCSLFKGRSIDIFVREFVRE